MRLFLWGAPALMLAISACAPDAWRPDPDYEAFLDRVQNACDLKPIGRAEIHRALKHAYFLDQTSRLFHGEITRQQYVRAMEGFYEARPGDAGVQCLFGLLPAAPSPAPGPST